MIPYGFGRLPSPPDFRDFRMSAAIAILEKELRPTKMWHSDRVLNQGQTPHCVGFAFAAWGIATPVEDSWDDRMGHYIYKYCKIIDGEPGAENGSTVRSGAKVLQRMGRINTYFFADSCDEALDFVARFGPVVFGTGWTDSMCKPSIVRNIIVPRGKFTNGHAYLVIGVEKNYGIIRNSWGPPWGDGGNARISIPNLRSLFNNGGEACAATENPLPIGIGV